MSAELAKYAPFIAGFAVFALWVATQQRYARQRIPIIAGVIGGFALMVGLDVLAGDRADLYRAPIAFVLSATLLLATVILPRARARLTAPVPLVAVLLLFGMVILAGGTTLNEMNSAVAPTLLGVALGLLPFILLGTVAFTIERLRRT